MDRLRALLQAGVFQAVLDLARVDRSTLARMRPDLGAQGVRLGAAQRARYALRRRMRR